MLLSRVTSWLNIVKTNNEQGDSQYCNRNNNHRHEEKMTSNMKQNFHQSLHKHKHKHKHKPGYRYCGLRPLLQLFLLTFLVQSSQSSFLSTIPSSSSSSISSQTLENCCCHEMTIKRGSHLSKPSLSLSLSSLEWEFHVAPMQGYTDRNLRSLLHHLSPRSILWTEMEKVRDLLPEPSRSEKHDLSTSFQKRLGPPRSYEEGSHLVLQLGSNDPRKIRSCLSHALARYQFREINLNCGCPSIESGGAATYGARLMKDGDLTGRLLSTVKDCIIDDYNENERNMVDTKVSLKCRIAVYETMDDLLLLQKDKKRQKEEEFTYLRSYLRKAIDANVDHIILHARPAILSGLNPIKNRIVPPLDYDFVDRIVEEFSGEEGVRFTLNGGIKCLDDLERIVMGDNGSRRRSGVHSHMAGRWCLRRPLDLVGVERLLLSMEKRQRLREGEEGGGGEVDNNTATTAADVDVDIFVKTKEAVKAYVNSVLESVSSSSSSSSTMANLCLPLYLVFEQLKDDHSYYYDDWDDEDDIDIQDGQGSDNSSNSIRIRPLLEAEEIEEIYTILCEGMVELQSLSSKGGKKKKKKSSLTSDDLNWKQMDKAFKALAGTKVVNKWKRNRSEL